MQSQDFTTPTPTPCPFGLEQDFAPFPTNVHVVRCSTSGKFGCYMHGGYHGLACFESSLNAVLFAGDFALTGLQVQSVTFEEAREIAKERPAPVCCLMLLDDPQAPQLHFVR